MMRAYLVFGPESSGTRLMTRILIAAGCHGDAGHFQPFDVAKPVGLDPIVWRRSIPHNRQWPDIPGMVGHLRSWGYDDIRAVVTTRDWHAMMRSQVAAGHVPDLETARRNLQRAYPYIFIHLAHSGVPFVVASYEALVMRPEKAQRALLLQLSLPPAHVEIQDANAKWYEDAA